MALSTCDSLYDGCVRKKNDGIIYGAICCTHQEFGWKLFRMKILFAHKPLSHSTNFLLTDFSIETFFETNHHHFLFQIAIQACHCLLVFGKRECPSLKEYNRNTWLQPKHSRCLLYDFPKQNNQLHCTNQRVLYFLFYQRE